MSFLLNHLPDVVATVTGILIQCVGAFWIVRASKPERRPAVARLVAVLAAAVAALFLASLAFHSVRVGRHFPVPVTSWVNSLAVAWILISTGMICVAVVLKLLPKIRPHFSPGRRRLLLATRAAVLASPAVVAGYGVFVARGAIGLREVKIPVPGLPRELDGATLVQLSDIHLSPFLSVRELERAVDMANETKADIGLVTGDLITTAYDPLDTCLDRLARLRTAAGTIGCLGNHESYANAEDHATARGAKLGIDFLRDRSRLLAVRGHQLNFVGVDYQRMNSNYLAGAERHVLPGAVNILLSHNPDVFPVAAKQGYQLTISGHTHGGQITVEILNENLSIARFYTPYVYGLYREGDAAVYVTRGIGTVGVPARIGAPPEVALIRLCAI
jgi:predicted MPP superfamily phosphohydrolase